MKCGNYKHTATWSGRRTCQRSLFALDFISLLCGRQRGKRGQRRVVPSAVNVNAWNRLVLVTSTASLRTDRVHGARYTVHGILCPTVSLHPVPALFTRYVFIDFHWGRPKLFDGVAFTSAWLSAWPGVKCCCSPAAFNSSIGSHGRLACLFSCFRIFINTKSLMATQTRANNDQRTRGYSSRQTAFSDCVVCGNWHTT